MHKLKLALYQPDIAGNVGAAIRLCACLGVGLEIIEPCGFPWDERKVRQSALDYCEAARITRHDGWADFKAAHAGQRIILMTTKAPLPYTRFIYKEGDILLAGSESAGVPGNIHAETDQRVMIPMQGKLRSLNIVNASAMILGEALRQVIYAGCGSTMRQPDESKTILP